TTATNTQELQALTAESLQRMEQSGANVSGQLLRLGQGSGSGSGVVPNFRHGSMPGAYSGFGPHPSQVIPAPKPTNNTLLIVVTGGRLLLAARLLLGLGLRDRAAGVDPGRAVPLPPPVPEDPGRRAQKAPAAPAAQPALVRPAASSPVPA